MTGGSSLFYADGIAEARKLVEKDPALVIGGSVSAPVNMVNDYGNFWFYTQHLAEMLLTTFGTDVRSVQAIKNEESVSAIYRYDGFTVNAFFGGDYGVTVYCKEMKNHSFAVTPANYVAELDAFVTAIRTGKVDRTLAYLKYPVALIDATIRAFTEGGEIDIVVPEI